MRWFLSCLVIGLCGARLLAAAGTGAAPPAGSPLKPGEAHNFAQQLVHTANEIAGQYVRPVTPAELLHAALAGLYEAVRQPVPANLQADLDAADGLGELTTRVAAARNALGDLEPLQGNSGLLVALRAMPRALDPYSGVVSGDELRRTAGEFVNQGVGLDLEPNPGIGPLVIRSVVPGAPAQRIGLRPGDRITHVNGRAAEGTTSSVLLQQLTGVLNDGHETRSQLVVQRSGGKDPLKVALVSQRYKAESVFGVTRRADDSWEYFLDRRRGIAHMRLGNLGHGAAEDMQDALEELKASGMRGLLLDLRGCPGGYLNEAVLIARMFLKEGTVASVTYRQSPVRGDERYECTEDAGFADFPLVLLVGPATSGGAELVAAALQDNRRAVVFGQRTVGKGSVQTMLPLPVPDAGLKLTTGQFVRPSGKNLHRFGDSPASADWGVRPDAGLEYPLTPGVAQRLREWWLLQTLRPGGCAEALPLDDPENDPQRQAAARVVAELIRKQESPPRSRNGKPEPAAPAGGGQ